MDDYIKNVRILVAGEQGIVIDFGNEITTAINRLVQQLVEVLNSWAVSGIVEVVPTYRSVIIYFDPLQIARGELTLGIQRFLTQIGNGEMQEIPRRVIQVPVCYGGVFGPDIDYVVRRTKLSIEEVIRIHTSRKYLVYMLGFTPGFPYLGGLDERLVVPRLKQGRNKIPTGSVGIAGRQTGFYTVESSGEWRLIGRTPLRAFYPGNPNPFLFAAGDYLQFKPISVDEFFEIFSKVEAGSYSPEITAF
ncbi:5-oxoprolinase subunit PxpB [Sporomusa acidovorans]|uniref:5-oxoprolinase subunit B n=1 Tax=Sporomusa acidovorans (strain ATCC 49682 / DSM 3132 / Mol) TaxID=1123286 RepID=A0ABZ3IYM0_SPOA4|nr:5-oxoprolinase subunit PxpB [Sporomusa acidovorans]OZC17256.1 kinase A inhibitor [Sporomusa acidovorans DSM 3132]SDF15886.1 inhibitor of KinA [Sporomusa acidovorans]